MRRALLPALALLASTALRAQTPNDIRALFARGTAAYVERHDYRAALALFDTLVAIDSTLRAHGDGQALSNFGNAYLMRSGARRHLGDAAGADRDLERALQVSPGLGRQRALAALAQMDGTLPPERVEVALQRAAADSSSPTFKARFLDQRAAAARHDSIVAANAGRIAAQAESARVASIHEDSLRQIAQAAEQAERAKYAAPPQPRNSDGLTLSSFIAAFGLTEEAALRIVGAFAALLALIIGIPAARYALARPSQVAGFTMASGERQVWIGAPVQGLQLLNRATARRVGSALVSLVVITSIVWIMGVWQIAMWVVPFVILSMAGSIGGVFNDARRRKHTVYALTTKRAIVSDGDELQSSPIEDLRDADLVEARNGTYSIEWGSPTRDLEREMERAIAEGRSASTIPVRSVVSAARGRKRSFTGLEEAFEVYDRIKELTGSAAASRPEESSRHLEQTTRHPERSEGSAPAVRVSVTSSASERATPRAVLRRVRNSLAAAGVSTNASDFRLGALFFGLFALAGLAVGYFAGWPALRDTVAARTTWVSVPCKVVSSGVHRSRGNDGSSFSVAVKFRYDYGGLHYYGDRYQIASMSQGGIGALGRIEKKVAAIPAGLDTTCWLDPARPDRAVIDRGIAGGTLLAVGLPALFAFIGLGGLFMTVRERLG